MLTFDEKEHKYWWDTGTAKRLIPSVTQIMKACGISKDYSSVPIMALDKARRRGSAVHEITELLDKGMEPDMSTIDKDIYDDVCNMVDAWEKFLSDRQPEIMEIEVPVYLVEGEAPLYAGTADRIITYNKLDADDFFHVVDIKTTSSLTIKRSKPEAVDIQLYLYGWAHSQRTGKQIASLEAVRLGKDGKYYSRQIEAHQDAFKRAQKLAEPLPYRYHNWEVHKNKRGMKRI